MRASTLITALTALLVLSTAGAVHAGSPHDEVVRVVPVVYLDANEARAIIGQLPGRQDVRILPHPQGILLSGPRDSVRDLVAILGVLDPLDRDDDIALLVFPVLNADIDALAQTLLEIFREDPIQIIADPRTRLLIIAGDASALDAIEARLGDDWVR